MTSTGPVRSEQPCRLVGLLYPVASIDAGVAFYGAALGLSVAFQDGNRFAALSSGGSIPVCLVAGDERKVAEDAPAAAYRVKALHTAVEEATRAGALLVYPPSRGPHEIRAGLRDPFGNGFVLSSSLHEASP